MTALCLLTGLGFIGWLWQNNLHARELAAKIAADTCRKQAIQLLDGGAVILQQFRFVRSARGFKLQRSYRFDYSTDGTNRQQGFILFSNGTLETIVLSDDLPTQKPQGIFDE